MVLPSQTLEHILESCCKKADASNYATMAFPAIGTGNLNYPKNVVAEIFFKEIKRFSKRNPKSPLKDISIVVYGQDTDTFERKPRSLLQVKVVVFMAEMLKDFHEELLSRSKKSAPVERGTFQSWHSRMHPQTQPSFEVVEIEPVQLQVFSNKEENIDKVFEMIETKLSTEEAEREIKDPLIQEFSPKEFDEMKALQNKYQVIIKIDTSGGLKIQGNIADVSHVVVELHKIMNDVRLRLTTAEEEELLEKTVQWMYLDSDEEYVIFTKSENIAIEKAYLQKRKTIYIKDRKAFVEFNRNELSYEDGPTRKIKRKKTLGKSINALFFTNINAVERSNLKPSIMFACFIGIFAAVVYGNGVYFAVNASYSANYKYSPPDANGRKWIYRARVLTGDYTLGTKGMIEPPPKDLSVSSALLYDSVTDDKNPEVFVIFNDTQAYPEYLIQFKLA
ncbi:protein mono-ADP-ribosyltransferase PARP14-like [Petromyzon marinus]|uniref:protein mono-ADP-ribosyltransferase PARP14-like n=1 Tax=Petromyzon marinus TaxID=7757 RepID=UPI003F71E01F